MSEEKKSFWQKIFSCCMSKPVEDNTEINSRGPKAQSNLFSDIKITSKKK
jgi:hypothetical protein